MTDLAATLRTLIDQIPKDVNWVLRVDGHTDATPIHTARFASNWELSAARAITVVKFLTTQGIPATTWRRRDLARTSRSIWVIRRTAFAKNRRIEIRLTDR
jgi:chemotaxis protein MotB